VIKIKEVFPKKYPFFYLHKKDIIKQENNLRLGKIKLKDKKFYLVEDEFTATKYKNYNNALKHYKNDIKINKEIERDRKLVKKLK